MGGCECVRVEVVVSVCVGGYECVRVEVVVSGWLSVAMSVESWADLLDAFSNTHVYSGRADHSLTATETTMHSKYHHHHPYIDSTTILSDVCTYNICAMHLLNCLKNTNIQSCCVYIYMHF